MPVDHRNGCLFAGCGSQDPTKALVGGEFEVAPKQFATKKFTLDLGGTYTMTLTPPQGGNLEAWVEPEETAPLPFYSANEPMPKPKIFADGKEDSVSGALGWGGAQAILFNRSRCARQGELQADGRADPDQVKRSPPRVR